MIGYRRHSRRAFLGGASAVVALPWLESALPRSVARAQAAIPTRFLAYYVPCGIVMKDWTPGTEGAHWCGAFANACLVKGGQPSRTWIRYTPSIVNNAKAGVEGWSWHRRPHVGDLVLFNWPGGDFVDHVGIVVQVNADGSVKTVEGNFQNRVGYWDRKSSILGYARPPWK